MTSSMGDDPVRANPRVVRFSWLGDDDSFRLFPYPRVVSQANAGPYQLGDPARVPFPKDFQDACANLVVARGRRARCLSQECAHQSLVDLPICESAVRCSFVWRRVSGRWGEVAFQQGSSAVLLGFCLEAILVDEHLAGLVDPDRGVSCGCPHIVAFSVLQEPVPAVLLCLTDGSSQLASCAFDPGPVP